MKGWLAPFTDAGLADDLVTVFLPGWGFDGSVLRLLSPLPPWWHPTGMLDFEHFFSDMEEVLRQSNGRRLHLVGWSMGAVFALRMAHAYPQRVARLSLVALRHHWPTAELALARRELDRDPEAFVRHFHRRVFAGDRASALFFTDRLQEGILERLSPVALRRGLDLLAMPLPVLSSGIPITLVHGSRDQVAPLTEMAGIAGASVEILPGAGHFPLTHPASFLQQQLKKEELARLFSRAAGSYDTHALAQKKAADILLAKLPEAAGVWPEKILELGCGNGTLSLALAQRFPAAHLLALDAAGAMVATAGRHLARFPRATACRADACDFLRQAPDASYDLIVSSAALQWLPELKTFFVHAARAITPGGRLLCAVFGPGCLKELGQGLAAVFGQDPELPVKNFATAGQLAAWLGESFPCSAVSSSFFTLEYPQARSLFAAIRHTGTGGGRRRRPLVFTRKRLAALEEWFAAQGGCRVSYEVIVLAGEK